jgi:hypothetical protein
MNIAWTFHGTKFMNNTWTVHEWFLNMKWAYSWNYNIHEQLMNSKGLMKCTWTVHSTEFINNTWTVHELLSVADTSAIPTDSPPWAPPLYTTTEHTIIVVYYVLLVSSINYPGCLWQGIALISGGSNSPGYLSHYHQHRDLPDYCTVFVIMLVHWTNIS